MSSDKADAKKRAAGEVQARKEQLLHLSHQIHDNPEIAWEEHRAAELVAQTMREAGFSVEAGAYGVPTAVEATYGDGDLTVAICAEYDALPGIGHACGHNVIASAGVGAALALAPVAGLAGLRIKLLGTPAEEHGGGKVALLEAGAWEDADFSLMVHGMSQTPGMTGDSHSARAMDATAVDRIQVTFHGRTAHAAGMPEQGINASNAAVLALNAFAMLRQQLPKGTNMNAFISQGGTATNIIPDRSVVQVEMRALDLDQWRDMKGHVLKCFEGAAIATGCTWEWMSTENPYAPILHDDVLADLWDSNWEDTGRQLDREARMSGASTDMGNVSQVVPSIHPLVTFRGYDVPAHNPAFAEVAASAEADVAVLDAAATMAATVLDVAMDPGLRAEFKARTANRAPGATKVKFEA